MRIRLVIPLFALLLLSACAAVGVDPSPRITASWQLVKEGQVEALHGACKEKSGHAGFVWFVQQVGAPGTQQVYYTCVPLPKDHRIEILGPEMKLSSGSHEGAGCTARVYLSGQCRPADQTVSGFSRSDTGRRVGIISVAR